MSKFTIRKLEAWGDQIPMLEYPLTHPYEFERYVAAILELSKIAEEYPKEEIISQTSNLLEVRFEIGNAGFSRVIYFITEE